LQTLSLLGAVQPCTPLASVSNPKQLKTRPINQKPSSQCLDLHSRLSQSARDRAAAAFASGDCRHLFASDVIARGLDFPDVTLVVQVRVTHGDWRMMGACCGA
jgi:superfamily II DNA/RNA helicase